MYLKMTRHSIVVVYDVHFMRVCFKDDKTQYSCGISCTFYACLF